MGNLNETIDNYTTRGTVTLSQDQYDSIINRLNTLETKTNYQFNSTPVVSVEKANSNATSFPAATTYFTDTNSYMTRNYNLDYFSYDSTNGFTVKKSGFYLINMLGHTSSSGAGTVESHFTLNSKDYRIAGRWNTASNIGQLTGWTQIYLSQGDVLNGYFLTGVSGINHFFNFYIYTFQ